MSYFLQKRANKLRALNAISNCVYVEFAEEVKYLLYASWLTERWQWLSAKKWNYSVASRLRKRLHATYDNSFCIFHKYIPSKGTRCL